MMPESSAKTCKNKSEYNTVLVPFPAQPAKQTPTSPQWNKDKSKDITAPL